MYWNTTEADKVTITSWLWGSNSERNNRKQQVSARGRRLTPDTDPSPERTTVSELHYTYLSMDMNCTRQYIIDPVSDKRLEGKGFVYAAVICRDFLTSITTSWAFTFGIIRHSGS